MTVQIDRIFQALSDPTRRAILGRLSLGPQSVSRLAEPLGVTVTAIGQHLQLLEETGFVRTQKQGRVRTCRLETAGFRAIEQWAAEHRASWERRLEVLAGLLADDVTGAQGRADGPTLPPAAPPDARSSASPRPGRPVPGPGRR